MGPAKFVPMRNLSALYTTSDRRGSNARSSKPTTEDEIHEAVRACNFIIAVIDTKEEYTTDFVVVLLF